MTPERYARIKALFLEVREQEAAQRAGTLERSCAGDPELRRAVEGLLAHDGGDSVATPGAAPSSAAESDRFASGEAFAGRYRIVSRLGRGGMGEVYRADDLTLGVPVALKFLHAEGPQHLARLLAEVRLAREVTHPAVCRVFDVGEAEGRHFFTMESIDGEDLASRVRRIGPLPAGEVLALARELCAGLAAAHECGVLHRDLKPANIMVDARGRARIVDFGIAIREGASDGALLGTPAYLAPEQLVPGGAVTAQTDLYALGLVLYELATGRAVFPAASLAERRAIGGGAAIGSLAEGVPELDPRLEQMILQALREDPGERPSSASAAARLLEGGTPGAEATSAGMPALGGQLPVPDPFVGRAAVLTELAANLTGAKSGQGAVLCLVGEPGIGKTRTAEELATRAASAGAEVLWGRCFEVGGRPALWPWLQILRAAVAKCEPAGLLAALGPGAPELARLVPEVGERLPDLAPLPKLSPEEARFRLFDAVTRYLGRLSEKHPLLIVVDDLHAADESSLKLFVFVAQELSSSAILLLGTYRHVAAPPNAALEAAVAELARLPHAGASILLEGFSPEEVRRVLTLRLADEPGPGLAAEIHARTEGNPFYVRELARLLGQGAAMRIPASVRAVVRQRAADLSEGAQQILEAAAVIGRDSPLPLLARVRGVPGPLVLGAVEEAERAGLLLEHPGEEGIYRFAHALVQETIYEELPRARRLDLHRRTGEALEFLHAPDLEPHLAALAHHFGEAALAGNTDRAIEYAHRAGEQAMARHAFEEAARQFERALRFLGGDEGPADRRRCELFLALGDAHVAAASSAEAVRSLQACMRLARSSGEFDLLGRAAYTLSRSRVGASGPVVRERVEALEEALGALGSADSATKALVLSSLADEHYWVDRERCEGLIREAVEVARRVGDPTTRVLSLSLAHALRQPDRDPRPRYALSEEMIHLAALSSDDRASAFALRHRLLDLLDLTDRDAFDRDLKRFSTVAGRLPAFQDVTFWERSARTARALWRGEFTTAERLATEAVVRARQMKVGAHVLCSSAQLLDLRRHQGRLGEVGPASRPSAMDHPAARCFVPLLLAANDRTQEARAAFETIARDDFAALPRIVSLPRDLALLSEACALFGDVRRAEALYQLLLPWAHRYLSVGGPGVVVGVGAGARYLGLLASLLDRFEDAARHFEQALAIELRMGARTWEAYARHDYGCMLLRRGRPGDRESADTQLERALAIATQLGMPGLSEKVRTLRLATAGVPSVEARRRPGARDTHARHRAE